MSVSGIDNFFAAPSGTAGTPDDAAPEAGWIDGGRVLSGADLSPVPGKVDDALGRPLYASSTAQPTFELADVDKYAALAAVGVDATGTHCVVALRKVDGKFLIFSNVRLTVKHMPTVGKDNVQRLRAKLVGAKHRARQLLSAETAPTV